MFALGKHLNLGQPINWANPLNRGLVSRWKVLNCWNTGSRFMDLAGKNHGTLTNGLPFAGAAGRSGGSGSLNLTAASSHYVNAGGGNAFSYGANNVSGFAWVRPTVVTAYQLVFGKDVLANRDWGFGFGNTSGCVIYYNAKGAFPVIESTAVMTAVEWQCIGFSRIGTAVTLYRNGVSVGSGTDNETQTATVALRIGSREYVGFEQYLGGNLDDLGLYIGRGLLAADHASLYQATRQQYDPTLNWLSPWLTMSEVAAGAAVEYVPGRRMVGWFNAV